jgi:CubicO group peptidase (beta-lactamase class C family)
VARANPQRGSLLSAAAGGMTAFVLVLTASGPGSEPVSPTQPATGETAIVPLDGAARAAAELPRLHSLLVSRDGELILEQYHNGTRAERLDNVKSVSKSLISALVGIAIERGAIEDVHQPAVEFLPELRRRSVDPAKQEITVEDLLTMRSGLDSTSGRSYGAWVQSRNWVRFALDRPLVSEPGTAMDYSTGNSHLLSAILTTATGLSTWEFADRHLARPLGFRLARWPRDPQGIYFGGNEMLLTPRQMVAFGELYLNRGSVNGRQVLPASWVDRSFVPRARSYWSDQLYGYGWWIRTLAGYRTYYAWGYGGQFIFVVPELQLVVATTSASTIDDDRRDHRRTLSDLVEHLVIGEIGRRTVS